MTKEGRIMVVAAWILLVVCALGVITRGLKFLEGNLNNRGMITFAICTVVTALSAGVIWGGLFQ